MTAAAYGQLIRTGDLAVLEYRRRFDHAPENVWWALSEPDRLAAWFPTTIDGERATERDRREQTCRTTIITMAGRCRAAAWASRSR